MFFGVKSVVVTELIELSLRPSTNKKHTFQLMRYIVTTGRDVWTSAASAGGPLQVAAPRRPQHTRSCASARSRWRFGAEPEVQRHQVTEGRTDGRTVDAGATEFARTVTMRGTTSMPEMRRLSLKDE